MGQGYVPGYPAGTNMRNPGRDANGNPINPNGLYSLGRTQSEIDSIMRQNTNNVILGGVGSMAGIGQAAPGSQSAQFAANQRGVQLNNDMYGGRAINFGQPDELTMGPNRQMAYDPARDAQTARTTAEWRSGAGNRWRSNYGGLAGLAGSRGQPGGR